MNKELNILYSRIPIVKYIKEKGKSKISIKTIKQTL